MFHEMRRKNQQLPPAAVMEVLDSATHGVLALQGDEPYPYALPMSFVFVPPVAGAEHQGEFYFHCALNGHKLEIIRQNPRASFAVVSRDDIQPEVYTTFFRSVIAFGDISLVTDAEEKLRAIRLLGRRVHPAGTEQALTEEVTRSWKAFHMLRFTVRHITGKESRELAVQRRAGKE